MIVHTHTSHSGSRQFDLDDGTHVHTWPNGYGDFFVEVSRGRSRRRSTWQGRTDTRAWWHRTRRHFSAEVRTIVTRELPFLEP